MGFITDYRLEDYILGLRWEGLPLIVQTHLKGCFLDLACALIVGSRSRQFEVGTRLAALLGKTGDIPVIGMERRLDFLGAAVAMGHSSNAFDIDDGYSLTSIHPGASFIGPLLAAAWERNLSRDDFLTALLAAYETTLRGSHASIDYYGYNHSTGSFGSIGVAAGVGRIWGFTREQLNNVLSIADFNATMAPGIRSVEYPSMNKDGVPFGVLVGVLALLEAQCGFTGSKNMLENAKYRHYLDDLGERHMVMELYFKPYPCCRWAQPAIDAVLHIMGEHNLTHRDVKSITVRTFYRASILSKGIPAVTDEAQYNIAYPVAAAAVHGDFGLEQVREPAFGDPRVRDMMDRLIFEVDPELEAQYPARRIARAQLETMDGRRFVSPECEPRGEAGENIGHDWLSGKFRRVTAPVFSAAGQARVIGLICGESNIPLRDIVAEVNRPEHWIG